jgi:hypothetical protein
MMRFKGFIPVHDMTGVDEIRDFLPALVFP